MDYLVTVFAPSDLDHMWLNDEAVWTFQHVPRPTGLLPTAMGNHPGYTVWRQAAPLGSFGAVMDSATSGELWAIFSKISSRYPCGIARALWRYLWVCHEHYGLTQLRAHVRAQSALCHRLALWLGMQPEAYLAQHIAGEDFVSYVWRPA